MSQLDQISTIENVLVRLIKCERYFEFCSNRKGGFWPVVQNSLGESACLFWCHIFGNQKDDFHYKNFFQNETEVGFVVKDIKSRMLKVMEMVDSEYTTFWNEVKACRDEFVSHKDLGKSVIFPRIDKCRIQVEEFRRILSEYSRLKFSKEPSSGWKFWAEYYSEQWLNGEQFKEECKRELAEGVVSLASVLTNFSNGASR